MKSAWPPTERKPWQNPPPPKRNPLQNSGLTPWRALEVCRIRPVIDRVFGFDEVLDAIRYYETGAKIGKIVIKVS